MNMNQFTQKSLAAIQGAQTIAQEHGNQQIEQEHLLLALLTTTMDEMRRVVELVRERGLAGKVKVMIGGAPTSREFCDSIGADCYTADAAQAAQAALALLAG